MPRHFPLFLAIATVVCLGAFRGFEYQERKANKNVDRAGQIGTMEYPKVGPPEVAPTPALPAVAAPSTPMRQWTQGMISAALTVSALFVILSTKYGPKDKHWAYGIIGTIVGFWFRS
jgi:hypothetical protein